MCTIGIVGKNYSESYLSAIHKFDFFQLTGIFDPSYQFEYPKNIKHELVYLSFSALLKKCDAIIFASPEKIYLPLIELALKHSKSVFLHSVHNLTYAEQLGLMKLHDEAGEILQIHQPIIYQDGFMEYRKIYQNPLLVQYTYSDKNEKNLLAKARAIAGAILSVFKSSIRKITANTISACSEVPDIIKVRIDFDNGGIAEILVNNVETERINKFMCFEYNSFYKIDLFRHQLSGKKHNHEISIELTPNNNSSQKILERQLNEFYQNIKSCKNPINSIENEMITQEVVDKIKEKLRLSINIF